MKTTLFLLSLALFVSCGKSSSQTEDAYKSAYGTMNGKSCDSNVVSDYNKLARICEVNSSDRLAVSNCIQQADAMISKYPNLKCTATRLSETTLEDETITITSDSIRKLQNGLTREKYLNYKNGEACGEYFLRDLAAAFVDKCKGFEFSTKYEVANCKSAVSRIMTQYPDLNCTYRPDSTSDETTYKYIDMKEINDELAKVLEI